MEATGPSSCPAGFRRRVDVLVILATGGADGDGERRNEAVVGVRGYRATNVDKEERGLAGNVHFRSIGAAHTEAHCTTSKSLHRQARPRTRTARSTSLVARFAHRRHARCIARRMHQTSSCGLPRRTRLLGRETGNLDRVGSFCSASVSFKERGVGDGPRCRERSLTSSRSDLRCLAS